MTRLALTPEYFAQRAQETQRESRIDKWFGGLFTTCTVGMGVIAVEAFQEGGANNFFGAVALGGAVMTAKLVEMSYADSNQQSTEAARYAGLAGI